MTGRRAVVAATLLYAISAVIITWPVAVDLRHAIYLSPERPFGDYTGVIAQWREMADARLLPFLPGRLMDFNAPDGLEIQWALNLATLPRTLAYYALTLVFGAVAGWNLYVLLAYIASGTAMFLLVRRETGSAVLGAIFGWAFAFYPFAVAGGEHPDLLHGWPLVIVVWRWLVAAERPTLRNGVLAGLAGVLAVAWTAYFILIGGVLVATLVAVVLIRAARRRELRVHLPVQAVAVALVGVWVVAMALVSLADPTGAGIRPNGLQDVVNNSSRPLNYALPTGTNPVTGAISRDTLVDRGWHLNAEKALYLGWSLMLLAAFAIASMRRRAMRARYGAAAGAALGVTVVAALFSGPPQIKVAGLLISLPSHAVFEITSAWRIFSRFVITVELGLVVLAAIGVAILLDGRSARARAAILAAVAIVVPLDLWSQFSPRTRELETPTIFRVLRGQPDGLVAHFPLRPTEEAADYRDLFYQQSHGKPMINGYPPRGKEENDALSLADPSDPAAAGRLAARGVTYALVERNPAPSPSVGPPAMPGEGFEEIASDDFAALFRVTAPVPQVSVEPLEGFSVRESAPGGGFRWLTADARISVRGRCGACEGRMTMRVWSFARARRIRVAGEGGRVLVERRIGPEPSIIAFRLRFDRETTLSVTARPGPEPVGPVTGSDDPRRLAVAVSTIRFQQKGARAEATTW